MVVFPQIALASIIIGGAGILKISDSYRKNLAKIKLTMVFFFILIGVYMIKELVLI